jgi:hypothetical protein
MMMSYVYYQGVVMSDDKLGDLVFLDEFRFSPKATPYEDEVEIEDYESYDEIPDETIDDYHFNYLTATDIASLSPGDVRWIIKHLVSRSDFEWRKEEAEKLIDEILEDREKEDT